MNNLRFSSGYPATAIKEELAPSRREEMENIEEISDNFQQGLRLCSPPLQASMDDYFINYHCSLVTRFSAHSEMSAGGDPKPKRSSSLDYARGLVTPKRSSSLPPILCQLIGGKKAVTLNLASKIKDLNHGTSHETLSNLSIPRTNLSTDDTDGSWTAGLQLVSYEDGSMMTKMSATPMERFHSGGEMSPNTVSHPSVPAISDNFDRVPSGPLANGTMDERAQLLEKLIIVAPPHLDNSVTSIEEQRRAAKMARALEEPFEFNSQNRLMEEYELQLTPMDNGNGFDFISLSPTFSPTSMENTDWETTLVFQFENQVRLGIKSESSPTQPQVPELKFNADGSSMTKMPGDPYRIQEQVKMETEMFANSASDSNLLVNSPSPNQPDFNDASFADGTVDRKETLPEDSPANASLDLKHSACSIQERRRAAKAARALEEPFQFNLQNMIMAEYELQISPMDFSYEHASNFFTPTFMLHSSEVGNREEQLNFQFPIQSQLEDSDDSDPTKDLAQQLKELSKKSKRAVTPTLGEFRIRDSKPIDAKADEQASIHARRLAARKVRQEEIANEFNGQNRVMYEYEQMEPIDVTDGKNYLCPSPIYQGSQTAELDFSSDSELPGFSSSSPTEDISYGNVDSSLPDYSLTFNALTSLEDQLHFMNLAKNDETGQDFFDQQRFVMAEYEKNEPMDVTNELSYKCSSPMFSTSSSSFTAQDSMDTKPTNNNQCDSCCESVKDPEHSTYPLLPSIDYSAQSLDQYERNCDERLNNGREGSPSHDFDNGFSDGWSRCAKDSGTCKNLSGTNQSYYEDAADSTSREVSPTGQQGDFPASTFSGLLGSRHFSTVLAASCSFDDEYENDDDDDDDEAFTEFNDQHLGSTQMEGEEDEHFPHSQSLGSASDTHSSSDVDIFVSAPSALERRVMSEFPGCSMEHARGMLDRRLHDKQLDSVDTCDPEGTVMMEFEAGLGSGVCDDGDDGFNGAVHDSAHGLDQDWGAETGEVCEVGTSQQSSLVNPPDSGGC